MKTLQNYDLTHSLSKCSLCGHELKALRSTLVIGANDEETRREQLKAYTGLARRLVEHLHKIHPEVIQQIAIKQAEYAGWIMLIQFDTDDAELIKQTNEYAGRFQEMLDEHMKLSREAPQLASASPAAPVNP